MKINRQETIMNDYYKILGIKFGASRDEIKKAFSIIAFEQHPDKGGDPEKFREAYEAYHALYHNKKIDSSKNPPSWESMMEELMSEDEIKYRNMLVDSYKESTEEFFKKNTGELKRMVKTTIQQEKSLLEYLHIWDSVYNGRHDSDIDKMYSRFFYIVGEPVQIKSAGHRAFFLKHYTIRTEIPDNEIIQSLPAHGRVPVFLNKNEAKYYSHFWMTGDLNKSDRGCAQSCVFTVRINAPDLKIPLQEAMLYERNRYGATTACTISFFEIDSEKIIPFYGDLPASMLEAQSDRVGPAICFPAAETERLRVDYPSVDCRNTALVINQ